MNRFAPSFQSSGASSVADHITHRATCSKEPTLSVGPFGLLPDEQATWEITINAARSSSQNQSAYSSLKNESTEVLREGTSQLDELLST
jgi:hypothetical protein